MIRLPLIGKHLSVFLLACAVVALTSFSAPAQRSAGSSSALSSEERIQALTEAVNESQRQLQKYQQQLTALQQQLNDLRRQLGPTTNDSWTQRPTTEIASTGEEPVSSSLQELSERQSVLESQIATHEVSKVETESKFPLKLSGLILFNTFVNTRGVDVPANPSNAIPSSGTTGFSMRQTVLGLDASGPHLLGATSQADVRADFSGTANSAGSYAAAGLFRLRTAHASLTWPQTKLFVELDRTLLAPHLPSSLVAVSEPEFSWSGNLWAWNPQIGVSQGMPLTDVSRLQFEAALIDVADPKPPNATTSPSNISLTERSRWPGTEARMSYARGDLDTGLILGAGGYFSPHRTAEGNGFNAWAGTVDARVPLGRFLQWTAEAYRGSALGGLGAGGYNDYLSQYRGPEEIARPLDDIGGWTQLRLTTSERLELNSGFGIDNPFGREIHGIPLPAGVTSYTGLARNRTALGNVIYGPSNYLLFSLEYRHVWSNYATGPTRTSNIIGLGAGYRF